MSLENSLVDSLLKGNLDGEQLRDFFCNHSDIRIVTEKKHGMKPVTAIYLEGMIDTKQFNDFYNPVLSHLTKCNKQMIKNDRDIVIPPIVHILKISEMVQKVFSGFLILYKEGESYFHGLDIAKIPQRTPEESKSEISIKGPKDAFTEEINVNISLIRKRLKTVQLKNECFTLGTLSQTKVSLLYLAHKANQDMIEEIKKRLMSFQSECIISSGQLEQWISDRTYSLFPLFDYTTRPDYAIECMLRGRFILIIDGSPTVLIGPANVFLLIKSPEDVHNPYYFVMLQRAFRVIGILISICLPGFWIAISSVNIAQMPFRLLATIGLSRSGIPMTITLETFLILGFFELLREASYRVPVAVGTTISIVGGLIIGDAAIRGGLTSPTLVVIVALTGVSTYTLVNQSLSGTVSILRLYLLIISSYLGVYGFFIGIISILVYICRLESFNLPYIEPVSSLSFKEYLSAFSFDPFKRRKFSERMIQKWRK